jgi:hypothetical protein
MDLELATLADIVTELRKRYDGAIVVTQNGDRVEIEGATPGKFHPSTMLANALEAAKQAEARWNR